MLISDFLNKEIKSNNKIAFFSTSSNYRSINSDISLNSHPHSDLDNIELELKDKYIYVERLFEFNLEISKRPKSQDFCVGFLYSNNIDVKKIIKLNN